MDVQRGATEILRSTRNHRWYLGEREDFPRVGVRTVRCLWEERSSASSRTGGGGGGKMGTVFLILLIGERDAALFRFIGASRGASRMALRGDGSV